ncbi:MAG: methyltransferase domain-containing protein [Thermofilum sp.]|nr:methyltransferase domain-containing protein [Thermofilum sp.]
MPYPVSEDTIFLINFLKRLVVGGMVVLEVGYDSGEVALELAKRGSYVVGTDVSCEAAKHAREKAVERGFYGKIDLVVADKAKPLRPSSFNIVISNPPYLPCDYEEDPETCGGPSGVEFSMELVSEAFPLLRNGGLLVLVASSLSNVALLKEELSKLFSNVSVGDEAFLGLFEKVLIIVAEKVLSARSARSRGSTQTCANAAGRRVCAGHPKKGESKHAQEIQPCRQGPRGSGVGGSEKPWIRQSKQGQWRAHLPLRAHNAQRRERWLGCNG